MSSKFGLRENWDEKYEKRKILKTVTILILNIFNPIPKINHRFLSVNLVFVLKQIFY